MEMDSLGPVEFFSGAMGTVITRKVKRIMIISDAVFTTLTFQFPQSPASAGAVAATTLTFPVGMSYPLTYIASFRLASGAIEVIYEHNR